MASFPPGSDRSVSTRARSRAIRSRVSGSWDRRARSRLHSTSRASRKSEVDVTMNSRDIYFLNVPERAGRRWEEFRSGGYLSTVGCARALDALSELAAGDVLAAYLRRCGYVGVGIVLASPQPVNASHSEYVLPVRW